VELRGSTESEGGVLVDRSGAVRALWGSFPVWSRNGTESLFAGLPAAAFGPEVDALRRGETPAVGDLGIELETVSIVDARSRGLGEEAANRLLAADRTRREVFAVRRVTAGTPASELLREGDLLLSVDGAPFTTPDQWLAAERQGQAELAVLRDNVTTSIELPAASRDGLGLERALIWSGAVLHESPLAMSAQRGLEPHGVYVGFAWYGSPAQRHRLRPTYRVIEVDGVAVESLDAFVAAVADREDRSAVRLQCLDLDGRERSITLRLDLSYWPTAQLERGAEGWSRTLR